MASSKRQKLSMSLDTLKGELANLRILEQNLPRLGSRDAGPVFSPSITKKRQELQGKLRAALLKAKADAAY